MAGRTSGARPPARPPPPPPPPARGCRMLVGARLQRRRRQPLLWPMNADPPPPPWVWMVPGSTGLLRLGAGVAPPPVLLAAAQPPAAPLLPGLPGWQPPGEPLLPLVPLPSAPDHAAAAAAHYYPLLHGQVTRPRPRSPVPVSARPSPGLGSRWPGRPLVVQAPQPTAPAWQPCIGHKVHALPPRSVPRQWFSLSRGLPAKLFGEPAPQGRSWDRGGHNFRGAGVAVQRAVLKSPPREPAWQLRSVAGLSQRS